MAEGLRDHHGGIRGLLDALGEHGEAIEHDLVRAGWTLDDVPHRLNWRALKAFVHHDALQRDSALHREVVGADDAAWGLVEHLLAVIADGVHVNNYQFAKANSKQSAGIKPPRPIPRPGFEKRGKKVGGDTVVSLDAARSIFAARNPSAFAAGQDPA